MAMLSVELFIGKYWKSQRKLLKITEKRNDTKFKWYIKCNFQYFDMYKITIVILTDVICF